MIGHQAHLFRYTANILQSIYHDWRQFFILNTKHNRRQQRADFRTTYYSKVIEGIKQKSNVSRIPNTIQWIINILLEKWTGQRAKKH